MSDADTGGRYNVGNTDDGEKILSMCRVRGVLHGASAICSVIIFGNLSEICDVSESCPIQLIIIIVLQVMGMISSILCMTSCCYCYSRNYGFGQNLEWMICILNTLIQGTSAALISSVRLGLGNVISVSVSWISVPLVAITTLFAITTENGPYESFFYKHRISVLGDAAPEANFMNTRRTTPAEEEKEEEESMVHNPLQPVRSLNLKEDGMLNSKRVQKKRLKNARGNENDMEHVVISRPSTTTTSEYSVDQRVDEESEISTSVLTRDFFMGKRMA